MALVYTNTNGRTVVKPSEVLTDGDIVTSDDPDKKSATFTFNLTEEPNKSSKVDYYSPAYALNNVKV